MRGYSMLAESYRTLKAQGKLSAEEADRQIKVLDFLGECEEDDIFRLVDTSAFNSIIKAYCRKALQEAEVGEKVKDRVMNEVRYIMDTMTAKEVVEND